MNLKNLFSGTKWHTWLGVILSIPIFIVGATAILIAIQDTYKNTESEPMVNVGWMPGYSDMGKESKTKLTEIKASLSASDGTQYYGTKYGVIICMNNSSSLIEKMKGVDIFSIDEFEGKIYFGAKTGLYLLEKNEITKISNIETHHVNIRKDGSIAIATNKKLYLTTDNGKTWNEDSNYLTAINNLPKETKVNQANALLPMHILVMDLHTGKAFFGRDYMNIWIILIGLSCSFLTVTGVIMWYRKLRKKSSIVKMAAEQKKSVNEPFIKTA